MSNKLFVKVENNEVTKVWDTPFPGNEAGMWRDAIEVRPAIVPHRQGYTEHHFDLTKNPVEIVWGIYDISVEDRKSGMVAQAKAEFQQAVNQEAQRHINDNPAEMYDPAVVEAARITMSTKLTAIEAAATHDELDALM